MKTTKPLRPHRTTVDSGGRVVLPAEALCRARTLLAPYLDNGPDVLDELLESRKRESRCETRRA